MPVTLIVAAAPSVLAPLTSHRAALSTTSVSNPVNALPMPLTVPATAADKNSSVSNPVPPCTAPIATAPGKSWNRLPLALSKCTAPLPPEMVPWLVTVSATPP